MKNHLINLGNTGGANLVIDSGYPGAPAFAELLAYCKELVMKIPEKVRIPRRSPFAFPISPHVG